MNEESESQALKRVCEKNNFGTAMAFKKDGGVLIYVHAGDEDVGGSLITAALEITRHREQKKDKYES